MDNFQTVTEILIPYAPIGIIISLLGMFYCHRRIQDIRSAKWIVENQNKPAHPQVFDEFIEYAEANGKKERALALLRKARTHVGHDNMKVGHVAWLTFVIDEDTPVDDIKIPTFDKAEK